MPMATDSADLCSRDNKVHSLALKTSLHTAYVDTLVAETALST